MKYAYIKYGNVAKEVSDIGPQPKHVPISGPNTFTANFLKVVESNEAMIISWDNHSQDAHHVKLGNIKAFTKRRPKGVFKFKEGLNILFKLLIFKPDVTLCVQDGPALWAAYLSSRILKNAFIHSRQRAIKVVGDKWHRRITALIDGFVLRRADKVICHGPFTKHQLMGIGVKESRIIEFDVHFDEFIAASANSSSLNSDLVRTTKKTIMFLGRLEESKGVFDLFEASLPILRKWDNVELVYIGNGGAMAGLSTCVEKENIGDQVHLAGGIPHNEVSVRLKNATLLATPTKRGLEGWPMAALEGLSLGIPVVAPNAGPFQFMIKDHINGLLFDSDNTNDLKTKIRAIIENSELRNRLSKGAVLTTEERKRERILDFGSALRLAFGQTSE